jgi:hypothetical protein
MIQSILSTKECAVEHYICRMLTNLSLPAGIYRSTIEVGSNAANQVLGRRLLQAEARTPC